MFTWGSSAIRFIPLTRTGVVDQQIVADLKVNVGYIVLYEAALFADGKTRSLVELANGTRIYAEQTVEEIDNLISDRNPNA